MGVDGLVGADQERSRTAGRVADGDRLEIFEASRPVGEQLFGILVLAGFGIDLVEPLGQRAAKPLLDEHIDCAASTIKPVNAGGV